MTTLTDKSSIRHTPSNHIDTFRDVASSAAAPDTATNLPMPTCQHMPNSSPAVGLSLLPRPSYRAPMTTSVHSVIKAIDVNRTNLSYTKRDLLLFFAQGHHLALGGDALFTEALYATDHGIALDELGEPGELEQPNNGALNTINRVLLRYADLSPADLRTLVRASTPWQLATKSTAGPRVEWAWLRDWFTRPEETDDPDSGRPTRTQLKAWAARRTG